MGLNLKRWRILQTTS